MSWIGLLWVLVLALPVQALAETVEYVHTDALGTPIAITDASGNLIETSEYEPYGKLLNRPVTDGPGFTGHVQDAATGLTYMQQRYYDPVIGRFLSVDPVTVNLKSGSGFNRYVYGNNNPYRFFDPDGRCVGSHISDRDGRCPGSDSYTTTPGAESKNSNSQQKISVMGNWQQPARWEDWYGRPLTFGEKEAAKDEFPNINVDLIKIDYNAVIGGFTPRNTIHFPSKMESCRDFVLCDGGRHIGWFIHELTHAWQYQNGVSPFWGHIFSKDAFNFGGYLGFKGYLNTRDPSGLGTEKQADWHMYNYLCRNGLMAGC
ncbi:RHS repeat domain-containing protein [Xanthomonas sacchari]|uniref:RHS repeat domain-containing protein n=1 Tax=Xanthomonas sacchari TaxID=56458 RepID=UPI0035282FF4